MSTRARAWSDARLDCVADLNARTGLIVEDDRRLLQGIVDEFTRRIVAPDALAAA